MKKILCTTDFSDAALSGISYAAKLAKRIDADLTLFNVVALTDLFPEEVLMGEEVNKRAAKGRLETQSAEVSKVFKISCYGEVVTTPTSVSQAIASKASGYDLTVMGTNGADDVKQFFLGSHTYRAIRSATIPVLMVPEKTVYSDPEHVVYAYDHWRNDHLPLNQLISFLRLISCTKLTVLQVMEESVSERANEEQRRLEQVVSKLYRDDVDMTFETIHNADVADGINSYMKKANADILALCSEHHGFLSSLFHKSVIKSVASVANFPVMVFHA